METRGTREFHQQFQYYKDITNRRLQDLEDLIEVAAMNMEILKKKKKLQTHRKTKVVNPFARKEPSDKHSKEHLHHLPKFNEGSVVLGSVVGTGSKVNEWPNLTEELLYASQETYTMKPIYDEEPGKSHKCWLDQPYTQSKACADPNEMVKRRNQPRSSVDSSVSTRTGDSLKFGKVTNLQGTSQTYEAREVIKLSLKQQEDMLTGGFCPCSHDKEGPSHECIQQGQFVMAQKAEMPSLEKSYTDEKSEITSAISENQIVHSMPHLELSPKFQGTVVCDSLQEYGNHWQADPIYDDASVYDDDPEKGQECWLEQEFISAALRGNNFYSSNLLQFEFGTSKRGEEKQDDVAEESPIILTTMRELSEDVPCRDGPTTPTYFGSEKNSSYLDKQNLEGNSTDAKLFAKNTKRKTILVAENEIADELNNSINLMEVSEVESAPEEVFSIISSNLRKRATNSYGLGKKTSNFSKTNWLVFDPGGQKPPLQFKGFCNTTITKLPNEGTLECASNCSDYKFKLNEEEIQVEGWKVELPEWNLILGVQWLSQLGELHCNYGMQPMQFEWHGKKLKLTSDSILDLVESCHHFTAIIPRWIEHICCSYEVDEKQDANEEVFSIITTNMGRSAEAFEKFPTARNSSNFKTTVHVFDSCIESMRAGVMARAYMCTVPRQDSPSKVLRIEVQEVWRRKYAITIFDPGGRKLSSEDQP